MPPTPRAPPSETSLRNSHLSLLLFCLVLGLPSLPARCRGESGKPAPTASEAAAASAAPSDSGDCLEDIECRRIFESARRLSETQQYNAALTGYQNAYALRPSPWLLINIGRVQQKMGRLADAMASFQRFLNQPGQQAPEAVAAAREYLKQAESDLAAQKEKEQRQPSSPGAVPPATVPPAAEPRSTPANEALAASSAPSESGDCLEDNECRSTFESARQLSDAQQYNAALTGYQNAYALRPSPWLLINIGRVQQKMGRLADAMASFQRFLNQPGQQAPEAVAAAREYLKQAESDLAAQKEKEQRQAQSLSAAPAESKPVYKRWWFWLLIGGTAAAAATAVGVGVGVSAGSAGSAAEPARAPFHIAF